MVNYNEHKCLACGQIYEYCRRCAVTPIVYKAEGFCSEECSHVFNTLSKHSCNLATAKEAFAELGNIEGKTFNTSIQAHIDAIKTEVGEISVATEEVFVDEVADTEPVQYFKKKKKW